jgi:hypothetical protein
MASRRGLAAFVAPLLMLAACTEAAAPPQPTAPPDAFASTPTIGPSTTTRPAPTTTLDIERAAIQRVDPRTLEPVAGFEPIPMGDWFWGARPSPSGRYFAVTVSHDIGLNEIRLIDVEEWQQVATWAEYSDTEIQVSDDATLYFLRGEQVRRLRPGDLNSEIVADLPSGFSTWAGPEASPDGRFNFVGTRSLGSDGTMEAFVSIVDARTGQVTQIDLPDVRVGAVDPVSQGPWAGYLYNSPSFSWDREANRLLAVHAHEDVVSEIDLESAIATEHGFSGPGVDPSTGTRRWSTLSPEGDVLYVSSTDVTLVEDDDDWSVTTTPAGAVAIDTNTWGVKAETDAAISELHLSPGGDRLLASGYETEEGEFVSQSSSSGLFLLDATDLSTMVHLEAERSDQGYWPITFSADNRIGYVATWSGLQQIHSIDLTTGEVLATAENQEFLDMIGSVRVLGATR